MLRDALRDRLQHELPLLSNFDELWEINYEWGFSYAESLFLEGGAQLARSMVRESLRSAATQRGRERYGSRNLMKTGSGAYAGWVSWIAQARGALDFLRDLRNAHSANR